MNRNSISKQCLSVGFYMTVALSVCYAKTPVGPMNGNRVMPPESAVRPVTHEKAYWDEAKTHRADPQWLKDVRFGIWYSYGVASLAGQDGKGFGWYGKHMYRKGTEDYDYHLKRFGHDVHYHDLLKLLTGEKFDAAEWVQLFEDSGAKMVGAMGEHHDGYSMWDSDINPWNSLNYGPGVDMVGAIGEETRKRGLKFMVTLHHGFHELYFVRTPNGAPRYDHKWNILSEWHPPEDEKYSLLYSTHVTEREASELWRDKYLEVVRKYSPDYLWTDFGPRFIDDDIRAETITQQFRLASKTGQDILINSKGDFFPPECAVYNTEGGTKPEIHDTAWTVDYAACPGWYYAGDHRVFQSPTFMQRALLDVVSKNGVFLLATGPHPDGSIPESYADYLRGMGTWLRIVGDGVYGTMPFYTYGEGNVTAKENSEDFNEHGHTARIINKLGKKDFRFTRKDETLYVFHLKYTTPGERILIRSLGAGLEQYFKVKKVALLGAKDVVDWVQDKDGLHLSVPARNPAGKGSPYAFRVELQDNFILEAEQAESKGLERSSALADARGGGYMKGFQRAKDSLQFAADVPRSGEYRMVVRYAAGGGSFKAGNRRVDVAVDGKRQLKDALLHASEKALWQTSIFRLQLTQGQNRITFSSPRENREPLYLDHITLLPVL